MPDPVGIVISHWILLFLSGFLVGGRLYARLFVRSNKPKEGYLGDGFVIVAWLSFFALSVTMQLLYNSNFFDPNEDYLYNATSYQLRLGYVNDVMMWPCLFFVKFAMLCFFDGVVSKELFIKTWWAIRLIAAVCVIAFLYSEGTTIFWCWPVGLNWDLESDCQTRSDIKINRSTWALHMTTDLMVYSLGFCLLSEMRNLPIREKLGAGCMFALGFVGIIVSSVAYWVPSTYFAAYVYRAMEQATLITITCIPSLRILFSRVWGRRKTEGSYASGSRTAASSNSSRHPTIARNARNVTGRGELDLTLTAEEEAYMGAAAHEQNATENRKTSLGWQDAPRRNGSVNWFAKRNSSEASSASRISGRTLAVSQETLEEEDIVEDLASRSFARCKAHCC